MEKPDGGMISIEPPNVKIHCCEQELQEPKEIWEFALDYENLACRLRSMLKLETKALERWQAGEEDILLLLSKLKELNSKELGRVMSIFAALGCSPQVVYGEGCGCMFNA